jgi:hypothetical protein
LGTKGFGTEGGMAAALDQRERMEADGAGLERSCGGGVDGTEAVMAGEVRAGFAVIVVGREGPAVSGADRAGAMVVRAVSAESVAEVTRTWSTPWACNDSRCSIVASRSVR